MLTVKLTVPQDGHVGKNAEILILRHGGGAARRTPDVQRLLDEAIAPAVARVLAAAGGHPLTAHLTATDTIRTPVRPSPDLAHLALWCETRLKPECAMMKVSGLEPGHIRDIAQWGAQ